MQIENNAIVPLSEGIVALSPEEKMEVGTRNLVLKRKTNNNEIARIKKIRNDSDILVRDVKPLDLKPSDLTVALPLSTELIKHPIQRKLEKNLKKDQKMARMVSSKALVKVKNEVKLENTLPARVDISTMRRLPWVDFDTISDNTESAQRAQVILDILQNNMPSSGDDMYYIYIYIYISWHTSKYF